MLNIFDPLFNLEDNDFLSVNNDGPLSDGNIENTIKTGVSKIAAINGYTTVQDISFNNHTGMDNLYKNDRSFIIPIFFEKPVNGTLGNSLTDANVSYMVITSLSGTISKPSATINGETTTLDTYSATTVDGTTIYGTSVHFLGTVSGDMLINLKFYRYMNTKLDYNPITSNFISQFYYYYIDSTGEVPREELGLFTDLFNLSLKQQLIVNINWNFVPKNHSYTLTSGNITAIGGSNPGFVDMVGNNDRYARNTCHCYNKIYMAYNQEE